MVGSAGFFCRALECVHGSWGPAPVPTRTAGSLLSNARCAGGEAGAEHCGEDAEWTRPPSYAQFDLTTGEVSFHALPSGCLDARVEELSGLTALLCSAEGLTDVYLRAPNGPWLFEGRLETALAALEAPGMAADGTVVWHQSCECADDCVAFLRPPEAAGRATWSTLSMAGARVWRPLVGGSALGLVGSDRANPLEASVYVVNSGGEASEAASLSLPEDVRSIQTDSGRLLVRRRDANHWEVAVADGSWAATALAADYRAIRYGEVIVHRAQPFRDCGAP